MMNEQVSEKNMEDEMKVYLDAIKADYAKFMGDLARGDDESEKRNKTRSDMIDRFNSRLSYRVGSKYIKVISDGSVHSFIVNTFDDKKFDYGAILKPAGAAAPARNQSRGNVFIGYKIMWTGPSYLRKFA